MIVAGGCSGGSRKPIPAGVIQPKKEEPNRVDTAETKGGEATRYSETGPRRALWRIAWGQATISYDGDGRVGGDMSNVDGVVYKDGEPASRFKAPAAVSEFGTRNLSLSGGVELSIPEPPSTLTGERVIWNPDADRFEAHGKVVLKTDEMTFGPFETLYASPDLKEISTPDLFRKAK